MGLIDACPAMKKAGISDPTTQRGIDFCTNQCPYPYCIMAEDTPEGTPHAFHTSRSPKNVAIRRAKARILHKQGKTITAIASALNVSRLTIQRYIRGFR